MILPYRKTLDIALLILTIAVVSYLAATHQPQLKGIWHLIQGKVAPCSQPLTYSIGTIDPRFGISQKIFVADLAEAESIWEKPTGTSTQANNIAKNLFTYTPTGGTVTVNLAYDARQASTDKLKNLGVKTDSGKASYDALKVLYDQLAAKIKIEKQQYDSKLAAYQQHEAAYNATVQEWNQKGGAPKAEYNRLQTDKAALTQEYTHLKSLSDASKAEIDTLNSYVTKINQLIVQLNLNISQYNTVGAAAGEFEEGVYELSGGMQTITIFEYTGHIDLVRVLAHEMGHALGLEHVADPKAIMYKINQGTRLAATSADMAELSRVCSAGL